LVESDEETLRKLQENVKELTDADEDIVFVDECLFNAKHNMTMAWDVPYSNMMVPADTVIGCKSVACVAGISAKRGLICFELRDKSIKQGDFCEFLINLRARWGDGPLNIILDNCRVHHSKAVAACA